MYLHFCIHTCTGHIHTLTNIITLMQKHNYIVEQTGTKAAFQALENLCKCYRNFTFLHISSVHTFYEVI